MSTMKRATKNTMTRVTRAGKVNRTVKALASQHYSWLGKRRETTKITARLRGEELVRFLRALSNVTEIGTKGTRTGVTNKIRRSSNYRVTDGTTTSVKLYSRLFGINTTSSPATNIWATGYR